jgi:hypothetical protein
VISRCTLRVDPNPKFNYVRLAGTPEELHSLAAALRTESAPICLDGIVGAQIGVVTTPSELLRIVLDEANLLVEGSADVIERMFLKLIDQVASDEELNPGPIESHCHVEYLGEGFDFWRSPDSTPLIIQALRSDSGSA